MAFSLGRRLVRPVVRRCRTAADAAIGLSLRLVDADSDSQVVTGSANRNVVPCVGAARRGAARRESRVRWKPQIVRVGEAVACARARRRCGRIAAGIGLA